MLSSNFIVSGVKSSRQYPDLILDVILFSILLINDLIGKLSAKVSCYFLMHSKYIWISDAEYEPSCKLNLLFLYELFILLHVYQVLRFDKTIYVSLYFKFILSARLSTNLCRLEVLLIYKFRNIRSISYYIYFKFIILLYILLGISLAQYKDHMISRSSSIKFSDT